MTAPVAFGLGIICGLAMMGAFCDWMLAEAQSLLNQAKALNDEALALVADDRAEAAFLAGTMWSDQAPTSPETRKHMQEDGHWDDEREAEWQAEWAEWKAEVAASFAEWSRSASGATS